jgi:predicted  nucleic acid-binding Zn-ribbon protein
MKKCLSCGIIIDDKITECPKCGYDTFIYDIPKEEIKVQIGRASCRERVYRLV